MRKESIERWVATLKNSFGAPRPPVSSERLRELFEKKDYHSMVGTIQGMLSLDLRISLGLVNSGGPANRPAWVGIPPLLPMPGTSAFRALQVTVYLRKAFLENVTFEVLVMAIAHEFSHIILNATRNPLRRQEEVVDLTAMLLGFHEFYLKGCNTTVAVSLPNGFLAVTVSQAGYLTLEEVKHATFCMS